MSKEIQKVQKVQTNLVAPATPIYPDHRGPYQKVLKIFDTVNQLVAKGFKPSTNNRVSVWERGDQVLLVATFRDRIGTYVFSPALTNDEGEILPLEDEEDLKETLFSLWQNPEDRS